MAWMGDDGRDEEARLAYQGLLNLYLNKPNTAKYKAFEEKVSNLNFHANESNALYDYVRAEVINIW